jgi:hypothetical protein
VGTRTRPPLSADPREAPIPLENIFIISLDEFDYLIACVATSQPSFGKTLRPAQKAGATTKELMLIQYLQKTYGDVPIPPYLKQEQDHRLEAIRPRFRK